MKINDYLINFIDGFFATLALLAIVLVLSGLAYIGAMLIIRCAS